MNQKKLFGFMCSEHGTAYSGLFYVKKNTLRTEKCMKYFSGTQSKEVSLRFLVTGQRHLAADILSKGFCNKRGLFRKTHSFQ